MEHGKREEAPKTPRRREPKRRGGAGRIVKRVLFVLMTLLLIGVCTSAMMAWIFLKYVDTTLTPVLQVNADSYNMNYSSFIYYQDKETGEWVEYQTIHDVENRIWVDIDDMPDALWQAAVAIEDERFFFHNGVDWKRTAGATVFTFLGMQDTYGGSTITQQVLKNMTGDNAGTVNRKVREIFQALEFEKNYTKWDILEMYLNRIYLGQGCYGVQTAAQYYFGKDVSELDAAECACLIAITNNPSMYGPMSNIKVPVENEDGTTTYKTPRELNKQRQENILNKMAEVKGPDTLYADLTDPDSWSTFLTEDEAQAAKDEILQFTDGSTSASDVVEEATGESGVNSWFVDQVIRDVTADLAEKYSVSSSEAEKLLYNGGYHIYTTLDPEIQEMAESVYEDRGSLNNLTSANGQLIHSGITIIDPYTGNIVAMVGDMGEKKGNLLWNYATDIQQPGSAIKPLTAYAPALDSGAITPATTFDNYPVQLLGGSPWPKNSPNTYTGWTSVATGIRNSINTIAVQSLEKGGVTNAFAFATENLGLDLAPEDMDVSPLGLGGLTYGLSTVDMAAAYATFVNSGIYNEPKTYTKVTDQDGNVELENSGEQHVAMKETTAYLMTTMLQDAINGTGGAARFSGMSIAGKTGTTNDNYDRYFVGYTPYYVAAVWVGYEKNERISYSVNPAASLWKQVMSKVHADLENKPFSKPSTGLTTITVCADSGMLCTDACRADARGNRSKQVTVATGTGPTEECTLHKMVDICSEGNCLAGEFCPEESIVQKGYLDYVREDYGASVKADDDAYLIVNLEKAFEESGGCPVHTTESEESLDPNDPNNTTDPNNPVNPDNPYDPDDPFIDDDPNNPDNQTPDSGNGSTGNNGGNNSGTQEEWWANIIGPAPST